MSNYDDHGAEEAALHVRITDLEKQLDSIKRVNQDNVNLMHKHANRADELEKQLAEKDREIARMRPVVDLAIAAKSQGLLPMYLDIAVGDYEAGEKP